MFYFKKNGPTVGVCDEELLGKTFKEGEIVLNVSKKYFGGERVGEKELEEILEREDIIWLVGKKCVNFAIKRGYVYKEFVKKVKGIPHINIYRIEF